MKTKHFLAISALTCGALLTSCGSGLMGGTNGMGTAPQSQGMTNNAGASVLGALLSGATGNSMTGDLLTGVIGMLTGGATMSQSVVGTWVYNGPSVEFESQNLLAQAGGAVASNQLKQKLSPYYEKLGIKPGAVAIQFNQDNTCIIQIGNKTMPANYSYDPSGHKLQITGQNLGLSLGTGYATVSGNQMSITFDSSKVLGAAQSLASKSGNSTLSSISELSKAFTGMKTGFLFTKQ